MSPSVDDNDDDNDDDEGLRKIVRNPESRCSDCSWSLTTGRGRGSRHGVMSSRRGGGRLCESEGESNSEDEKVVVVVGSNDKDRNGRGGDDEDEEQSRVVSWHGEEEPVISGWSTLGGDSGR